MTDHSTRKGSFRRNHALEDLLTEINGLLAPASQQLRESAAERFSKILVVGPPRSGSTLFMQWLAASGLTAYPTNLLSRFYGAPLVGAKIQQLLTDPRYNFRDEILDFTAPIDFTSQNGKTRGATAPNEFWYFWRRFLPFDALDYMPDDALKARGDLAGLRDELNALANIFERPFALKAMIMNQNLPVLSSLFEKALFVWIKRNPVFNVQSALEARRRQHGNLSTWYSFKIKEYPQLKARDPLASVAGQVHAINNSLSHAFASLPEDRTLVVQYEDFCRQPARFYTSLVERLQAQDGTQANIPAYDDEVVFTNTNTWRLEEYSQRDVARALREAEQ